MKKKRQLVYPVLLLMSTIILGSIAIQRNFNTESKFTGNLIDTHNISSAALSHSYISIDGNAALVQFFVDHPDLGGDGSFENPYIIENFEINGDADHGISIQNTNAYLIIKNCIINSNNSNFNGIQLVNVWNVNITDNIIAENQYGVFLDTSYNNTITGNSILDSRWYGIQIDSSEDNLIIDNLISNSTFVAIGTDNSHHNTFLANEIASNYHGFEIGDSHYNNFTANNLIDNDQSEFMLYASNHNNFTSNMIYHGGFYLNDQCANNSINLSNKINDKSVRYYENIPEVNLSNELDVGQVILLNCTNSTLENLNISNTTIGIFLRDSDNFSISGNSLMHNIEGGLYIDTSSYGNISENLVNNSYIGMTLVNSLNCTVATNEVYNCVYSGYSLGDTINCTFANNSAIKNNNGISCGGGLNNTIIGNDAHFNNYGISLHNSDGHLLIENNISNSYEHGMKLSNSNKNTFFNNLFNNTGLFLDRDCTNNLIDLSNKVNGDSIRYYENIPQVNLDGEIDVGQVILVNCSNSTIKNLMISNTSVGISVIKSDNCSIRNNILTDNQYGVHIEFSLNNSVIENSVNYNVIDGIWLYYSHLSNVSQNIANFNKNNGIHLFYCTDSMVNENSAEHNTIDGLHLYGLMNSNVIGNTGNLNENHGMFIQSSEGILISENTANTNGFKGIGVYHSPNSELSGNIVNNNGDDGISAYYSNSLTITGNILHNNAWRGICLSSSSYNILAGNMMYGTGIAFETQSFDNSIDTTNKVNDKSVRYYEGQNNVFLSNEIDVGQIILSNCNNSVIERLNISNTLVGILVIQSENCLITKNTLSDNQYGIYLYGSTNNNIYCNEIFNNSRSQAFEDFGSINNQWDFGSYGNYWGNDYIINYSGAINNGLTWDIPYHIPGGNGGVDNFPLIDLLDYYYPAFSQVPDDLDVIEEYSTQSLSWVSMGLIPSTYDILIDGIKILENIEWKNGAEIIFTVPSGLDPGKYNITIQIRNEIGDYIQDTVIITIKSKPNNPTNSITDDKSGIAGPSFWIAGMGLITIVGLISSINKKKKYLG